MSTGTLSASAVAVARRVAAERPKFHLADRDTGYAKPGQPVVWNSAAETLDFIARNVRPGTRTLEIGSGASTVVFAAAGARHIAISPVSHEHERIAEYCDEIGVSTSDVVFIPDSSDAVVPTLETDGPLDLILLDGTHAFPYAVVEWHFLRRLLRPGGLILVDDVPIPAVAPVYRFMSADPDWQLVAHLDRRTAAFRKLRETRAGQTWPEQGINRGYPDLSFLPPGDRLRAAARHHRRKLRNGAAARFPALRELSRRLRS